MSKNGTDVRVGLVLGAGGILGGAWLIGALHALTSEIGWDPGSADCLVGTSAGAMIAALCASGVPPWYMLAHSAGETEAAFGEDGAAHAASSSLGGGVFRLHPGLPALGPGSWRLALASLARPYRYAPAAILAGWLPQGVISSEPLKQTIRGVVGDGWAPHPGLSIIACDHDAGRRVEFGTSTAPRTSLADAVAASCAIPGFYRPVTIDGRRYVDGGVVSTSNLDLLTDRGLDLVVCLNPTSSLHEPQPRTLGERAAAVLRQRSGRMLQTEAKRLRASGTEVVLIQPTIRDLDAIGTNLMSSNRRHHVIEVAAETVGGHLRMSDVRARLRDLPPGQPLLIRRPDQAPDGKPDFLALARQRWAARGWVRSARPDNDPARPAQAIDASAPAGRRRRDRAA